MPSREAKTSSVPQPAKLREPREIAAARINARITAGEQLLAKIAAGDGRSYDPLKAEYDTWHSVNIVLLEQLFDGPKPASEYRNITPRLFGTGWGDSPQTPRQRLDRLDRDVGLFVERLRTTLATVEVFEESEEVMRKRAEASRSSSTHARQMAPPSGDRPRLFIGSSYEGRDVAFTIQQDLDRDCLVTVWTQDVFDLSGTNIESLERALDDCDFAVLVFTPDDVVKIRGEEHSAARDNVVFELGLFMGRLGRERTYIVRPRDASGMRLPTDLLGVTPAQHEADRPDGNLRAALGPASHQIRTAIRKAVTQFAS